MSIKYAFSKLVMRKCNYLENISQLSKLCLVLHFKSDINCTQVPYGDRLYSVKLNVHPKDNIFCTKV